MANIDFTASTDPDKRTNLKGHTGAVQGAHVSTIRPFTEQSVKQAARDKFNKDYNDGKNVAPGIWGFLTEFAMNLGKVIAGGIQAVGAFFGEIFKGVWTALEAFVSDIADALTLDSPTDKTRFPQITQAAGAMLKPQGEEIARVKAQAEKASKAADEALKKAGDLDGAMDERIAKIAGNSQKVKELIQQIGQVSQSLEKAEQGLDEKIREGVNTNEKLAGLVKKQETLTGELNKLVGELEQQNEADKRKAKELNDKIATAQATANSAVGKAGDATTHADSLIKQVRETQATPGSAIPVVFGTATPAFTLVGVEDRRSHPTGLESCHVFTGSKTVADETLAQVNPRCEYEVHVWARASQTTSVAIPLVDRAGRDAVEQTYTTKRTSDGQETVSTFATSGLIPGGVVNGGGWHEFSFRLRFKPGVSAVRVPKVSVAKGELRLAGVSVVPYAPSTVDILDVHNRAINANTKAISAHDEALKAQGQFNDLMAGKWDKQTTFNREFTRAIEAANAFDQLQLTYNRNNDSRWGKQQVVNHLVNDVNKSVKDVAKAQAKAEENYTALWKLQAEKNKLVTETQKQQQKQLALTAKIVELEAMKNSASFYCPLNRSGFVLPNKLLSIRSNTYYTHGVFPFTQHRGTIQGVSYMLSTKDKRLGAIYIDEPGEWEITANVSFSGHWAPGFLHAWSIYARAANTGKTIDIRTGLRSNEHGKFNGSVTMRLMVPKSWCSPAGHYAIITVELEKSEGSRKIYLGSRYTTLNIRQVSRDYTNISPHGLLGGVGGLVTD